MTDQYPINTRLSEFRNPYSFRNKAGRLTWGIVYRLFFRTAVHPYGDGWRNLLLKGFGADVGVRSWVHPRAVVWAPWCLSVGDDTCISSGVDVYNAHGVVLGDRVVVSQRTFLCTVTHDIEAVDFSLKGASITIKNDCWIAAEAFIHPGVTIGEGAVVGARAVVVKDVPPWSVVAGNPARVVKQRVITAETGRGENG